MRLIRALLFVAVGVVLGVGAMLVLRDRATPPPTSGGASAPSSTASDVPDAAGSDTPGPAPVASTTVPGLAASAEGEVRPLRVSELAFGVSGVLAERYVEVGQSVAANAPLLRLDDGDQRARLSEAEAGLATATAQVEVARSAEASAVEQVAAAEAAVRAAEAARDAAEAALRLTATQAEATQAQARANFRQAEAGVSQARATVSQARAAVAQAQAEVVRSEAQRNQAEAARASAALAVERRILRAPFAGRVVALQPEVGESVAVASGGPAAGAVTLADTTGWRVDTTNLTELQVVGVEVGDRVVVEVDALPDRTFDGTVEEVGYLPAIVRGDVTYVVSVRLETEGAAAAPLRPGMTAIVRELLP